MGTVLKAHEVNLIFMEKQGLRDGNSKADYSTYNPSFNGFNGRKEFK
jgi:hypothetical protein